MSLKIREKQHFFFWLYKKVGCLKFKFSWVENVIVGSIGTSCRSHADEARVLEMLYSNNVTKESHACPVTL
jgi:hypothetical protein